MTNGVYKQDFLFLSAQSTPLGSASTLSLSQAELACLVLNFLSEDLMLFDASQGEGSLALAPSIVIRVSRLLALPPPSL